MLVDNLPGNDIIVSDLTKEIILLKFLNLQNNFFNI